LALLRERNKKPEPSSAPAEPGRRGMMNRKDESAVSSRELNALLGRGSEFDGKLIFEGTVRIDGKFKGEIHSKGRLIVGENGEVIGEIWVDNAIISGKVKGNINAQNRVELQPPARLEGNITASSLVIQEGAIFDGNCQMSKKEQKAPEKPTTSQ